MKKYTILLLVGLFLQIYHAKAQSFTNYTVASTSTQLCNHDVTAIVIDNQSNKWFGTDNGISELSAKGSVGIKPITNKNHLDL